MNTERTQISSSTLSKSSFSLMRICLVFLFATLLLTLFSKASYAGYQGGIWRTKVEFEKLGQLEQCDKVTNAPDCSKCTSRGTVAWSATDGTERTITANVTAEARAGIEATVWKITKITGEFELSTSLSGTWKNDSRITKSFELDMKDGCGYSLGLDEKKTNVWTEKYELGGTTFNRSKREEKHTPAIVGRPCDWDGSLPLAEYKHGNIDENGVGDAGKRDPDGW